MLLHVALYNARGEIVQRFATMDLENAWEAVCRWLEVHPKNRALVTRYREGG